MRVCNSVKLETDLSSDIPKTTMPNSLGQKNDMNFTNFCLQWRQARVRYSDLKVENI
jgi:hypothetical protein